MQRFVINKNLSIRVKYGTFGSKELIYNQNAIVVNSIVPTMLNLSPESVLGSRVNAGSKPQQIINITKPTQNIYIKYYLQAFS